MNSVERRSFRAVLSLLFLDNLGLTVVYPIFTPLVLKPIYTLLPYEYPLSIRIILLGLLIASFPFAQFIAGPIIGHIADLKGRKFAFILALVGEGVGFFLTGLSVLMMNYSFLFFSRLFTGFFAGNMTICLSAISDMTGDEKSRSRSFGIVSSVVGISFVIAIVIGGTLSNEDLNVFFNSSLPFWAMTVFSLINILIVSLMFRETVTHTAQHPHFFKEGLKELWSILKQENIKYLYGTFFFFMLGWIVSLQFLSSFLIEHFTGTKLAITLTFVGVGLAWCIGNIGINRILIHFFRPGKILFYTLLLSTACLFASSEARSFLLFIHLIIIGGLSASIAWTNCLTLISISAPDYLQGKLLGINQSVATLSMAFAPLFGGMVGEFDIRTIYLFASCSLLISTTILIINKLKNRF